MSDMNNFQTIIGKNKVSPIDAPNLGKAIDFLVEQFSAYAVYLFGSAAKEALRIDSDIDIAFSSFETASALSCFEAAQYLADILGHEVDLINMKNASTVLRMQIIAAGKRIYCSQMNQVLRDEMIAYKSYAMLNEERQEILFKQ